MMDIAERIKCLEQIDLFHAFSGEELKQFAEQITEETFENNQDILTEGEPGEEMYILLQGSLKVYKESRTIAIITPVDYVGEMAIIETKPRSASVRTQEPCRLLKITSDQFKKYLAGQPKSLVSMMKTLSRRIRQDTVTIASEYEKANIMIHDMKNLLSVFLYLSVIKRELTSDVGQKAVAHMTEARQNLALLMEEALANARHLQQLPVLMEDSLSSLILDLIESELKVHPDVQDKKISIAIDNTVPNFLFSRLDIRRVIVNLILNAAQASNPGDTIAVELKKAGNYAEVHIIDNGCGILESAGKKIFEPHFTTKENGSGLGLPSCKYIVEEKHDGVLTYRSSPNRGATFVVRLPLGQSS
ncbi:MAG: cyclic nucleotide-binding domain-containing protein [Desulfobulbaceae bacterium]|nr:cyclic nucleotide-binding domain-containing protein [Desulfobulbaceae bacterium]